jgi:hypothetical protein
MGVGCGKDLTTHWRWKRPIRGNSRRASPELPEGEGEKLSSEVISLIETHYLLDAKIDDGEMVDLGSKSE